MSAESTSSGRDGGLLYLVGLLTGGLVLGFGLRSLYWTFGWAGHECLNCELDRVGYSGLDELQLLDASEYSVGMVVAGVLVMVVLNGSAWRRTNGY